MARYTPAVFLSHFRMSFCKVEEVTALFGRHLSPTSMIPPLHQVLLSISLLANQVTFREVADRFNVTKSSAWTLFMDFCSSCAARANEFVKWPNDPRAVMDSFQQVAGFPGVVGCIGSSHIQIRWPSDRGHQYLNWEGVPSIILLAVCDDAMRFTWINSGWPGSVQDARVYRNTLQPLLEGDGAQPDLLSHDGHLLGDTAFPLSPQLIVPFRDNDDLSVENALFNKTLSSTRITIDKAFGRLKEKFRRLKLLEISRVDLVPNVITAACVLHNLSLGGEVEEEQGQDVHDGADQLREPDEPDDTGSGAVKRDQLATRIWAGRTLGKVYDA